MADLVVERHGALVVARLDRPSRHNTIDEETCDDLLALLRQVDVDPSIRSLVITGTGRFFCTGGDVRVDPSLDGALPEPLEYRWLGAPFQELFRTLWQLEKPVVSAVNGSVAGVGWMLALLADLVVAASDARWGHAFLRRGLIPHAGDPFFLPRLIPLHRLNELAMLGDLVTSADLHAWGLVNRSVDQDDVLSTAVALGERLAAGPTRSLGLTKRLYRRSLVSDMATSFAEERDASALLTTTTDRQEGLAAFAEGRPPDFVGR